MNTERTNDPYKKIREENSARLAAIKAAHAERLKAIKTRYVTVSNSPHSIMPILAAAIAKRGVA